MTRSPLNRKHAQWAILAGLGMFLRANLFSKSPAWAGSVGGLFTRYYAPDVPMQAQYARLAIRQPLTGYGIIAG